MEHWPSGGRDTTQWPDISINFDVSMRDHLNTFCGAEGINWNDSEGLVNPDNQSMEPSRFRTLRKMYERMGLIFKGPNGQIRLSDLGKGLCDLEKDLNQKKNDILYQLTKRAINILSKYQFRNPVDEDSQELPEDFDVLPFLVIWKTMVSLDNKLHYEEINRVILKIMKMSQLDDAINKIRSARQETGNYQDSNSETLDHLLGEAVFTDQASARIAPWFSYAGWGGLVISRTNNSEGFRTLEEFTLPLINNILSNPPSYKTFSSDQVDEWYEYFLSDSNYDNNIVADEAILNIFQSFVDDLNQNGLIFEQGLVGRFIASLLAKPFVILSGLSGSGKTNLALAFAKWISPTPIENNSFYKLVAVGADWTSKEELLGYADALNENKFIKLPTLDLLLKANNDTNNPYHLILDEMNLSHVERYFADFLSAMETGRKITLYGDSDNRSELIQRDVPSIIDMPENLFIIGTINVDETTYMFSPKVLDRANVLEFRMSSSTLQEYLNNPRNVDLNSLNGKGSAFAHAFQSTSKVATLNFSPEEEMFIKEEITLFYTILSTFNCEFGFRTINEIRRFIYFHKIIGGSGWSIENSFDAQIYQKLLPKFRGSRRTIEPILVALANACYSSRLLNGEDNSSKRNGIIANSIIASKLQDILQNPILSPDKFPLEDAYYPESFKKIIRIMKRLSQEGFAGFTEA